MAVAISLKLKAYDGILAQILCGEFGPGILLNRRGLAESLGMSVAPVHEAMLQAQGVPISIRVRDPLANVPAGSFAVPGVPG